MTSQKQHAASECGAAIPVSCADRFDRIDNTLEGIDLALRGNGKPGLKQRVDRLEEAHGTLRKVLWGIIAALTPFAAAAVWKAFLYFGS